jgi:hypothetical protein
LRVATPKETEKKQDPTKKKAAANWNLEVRPDAQKEHLGRFSLDYRAEIP